MTTANSSAFPSKIGGVLRDKQTGCQNHSNIALPTASSSLLKQQQKQQQQQQQGITVAIRMRPLKHETEHRIWKVLPEHASITQLQQAGSDDEPIPNPIAGKTFFTFDKTFDESTTTHVLYNSIAKNIVTSVLEGMNGTIFAYGQTSSGKTFTMQGSGTIQDGASLTADGAGGTGGGGGIVHMAAKDIFYHIQQQQRFDNNRKYQVKASFLEIYNEEVRDLLSPSTDVFLPIRQDKKRGIFVQSQERSAIDSTSLLEILFEGEKSRAVAATGMNERSSRSHTIFRVTIESQMMTKSNTTIDKENSNNNNSHHDTAIRVATLDLVDLAGSESVRHTGATGDRQKEGGMINQSLLTLSRVISALGQPNQKSTHVNFRDSKLTRLLQTKLSGNANIAIICCATPSSKYLEETRSTLQFASRAKLVKTSAKVNEQQDDKSIIRRLKQELAEARKVAAAAASSNKNNPSSVVSADKSNPDEIKELRSKVEGLNAEATQAKQKFERLQSLFQKSMPSIAQDEDALDKRKPQKRKAQGRFSDVGFLSPQPSKRMSTPNYDSKIPFRAGPSMTCPRPNKKQKLFVDQNDDDEACATTRSSGSRPQLSPVPLNLVRDALSSKSRTIGALKGTVNEYTKKFEEQSKKTTAAAEGVELVREENQRLQSRIVQLEQLNTDMENQLRSIESVYESGSVVSSREIRAGRREILKAAGRTQDSTTFRRKESTPDWPNTSRSEEITTKEIPHGLSIDMRNGDNHNFCTFQFGTLEFLVLKDLADDAISSFKKLFLPPVGWILSCPYNGCTFRCRNPASLCSHLERRAASGGGSCVTEPSSFSHRGPMQFFLHESVVHLLKQCSNAQNVKPRDILNPDAIPVAFGPAAKGRWDGFRDELNYEKRLISKVASRFPNGLLESLVEEKDAWFIQQEAKRKNSNQNRANAGGTDTRPKEYPHLLTMGFLKLPKHYSKNSKEGKVADCPIILE